MTIHRLTASSASLLLLLLISSGVVVWTMHQRFSVLSHLDAQQYQTFALGHEFRNSSLALTRFVREYLATGDHRYEDAFHATLSERAGDTPRPATRQVAPGQRIALLALLQNFDLTDSEKALFARALNLSNALALLEIEAINAFNGRFPDASGRYTIQRTPDPVYANSLVFSENYQKKAAEILSTVDSFFFQTIHRMEKQKAESGADVLTLMGVMTLLLAGLCAVVLGLAWYSFRRIVHPIRATCDIVNNAARGNFSHSLQAAGNSEIQQLQRALDRLLAYFRSCLETNAESAYRDVLTGLWNRRKFIQLLGEELARTRRYGHTLALIQADIDNFRHLNWDWGQEAGDAVLRDVARMFTENLRKTDAICRQGDDTFLLLLPEVTASSTLQVMEKLRVLTGQLSIGGENAVGRVTLSLGACLYGARLPYDDSALQDAQGDDPEFLLKILFIRSETALLQARTRGGDAACLWTPDPSTPGLENSAPPHPDDHQHLARPQEKA